MMSMGVKAQAPTTCVLLDTSASMNQRTSSNLSLLDAAKAAIEHMVRRFPNERHKFLLVTTKDGGTVEAGWGDSQATFLQKVKMAVARDLSDIPSALRCCFDLLEKGRSTFDIDSYGQGRQPWVVHDSASVWVVTDGAELSNSNGPLQHFVLPPSQSPCAELFSDPFRWEQRVWMTVLRFPGCGAVPMESSNLLGPAAVVAEMTGGRAQVVLGMRSLMQAVESLSGRLSAPTVAVRLVSAAGEGGEGADDAGVKEGGQAKQGGGGLQPSSTAIMSARTPRPGVESLHAWPIAEPFLLTEVNTSVVPRPAVPTLTYKLLTTGESPELKDFPFDHLMAETYDIETCQVTEFLRMELRNNPRAVLQLYVRGSNSPWPVDAASSSSLPLGDPVGFLRIVHSGATPTPQLVMLPYNYPKLCEVVEDFRKAKGNPPVPLRQEVEAYVRSVPPYYIKPLRVALRRIGVAFPERNDPPLPLSLKNSVLRLKQLKSEADKTPVSFPPPPPQPPVPPSVKPDPDPAHASSASPPGKSAGFLTAGAEGGGAMAGDAHGRARGPDEVLGVGTSEGERSLAVGLAGLKLAVAPAAGEGLKTADGVQRNAFDVGRGSLLVQLRRMRFSVLGAQQVGRYDRRQEARHDRSTHSVPIADMGNFHEVLRKREAEGASPLRDPLLDYDEVERRRRHQFGNPFRKGEKGSQAGVMSDEIDEAPLGGGKQQKHKRRRGARRAGSVTPSGSDSEASSRESSPAPPDPKPAPAARAGAAPSNRPHSAPARASGGGGPEGQSQAPVENGAAGAAGTAEDEETVNKSNRWSVKLALMRLVRGRASHAKALLRQAERLRGEAGVVRKLLVQLAEFARQHRKHELAASLLAIRA